VSLTARVHDGRIRIEVRDEGPGLDPAKGAGTSGVGLRNTAERLKYLYGSDHAFGLSPLEGGGLLVAMELPVHRS
jgi:sensor histidine kinase YesM